MFKPNIDVIVYAVKPEDEFVLNSSHNVINQTYCELLSQFGYTADWPVADFLKRYYGLNGSWHVISPIFWEATHQEATIRYADASLSLSDEDSKKIFNEFAAFAAQDQIRLFYHDAHLWLMESPKAIAKTRAVHELIDRPLSQALRDLESTPYWLRFLTESQMFFSGLQCPVNGVWIWGGARSIDERKRSDRPLVICGDQHWLGAGSALSTSAVCFQEQQRVKSNSVYFVPNMHWLHASQLMDHLSSHRVRWHWQNVIEISKPKPWLYRLFR